MAEFFSDNSQPVDELLGPVSTLLAAHRGRARFRAAVTFATALER